MLKFVYNLFSVELEVQPGILGGVGRFLFTEPLVILGFVLLRIPDRLIPDVLWLGPKHHVATVLLDDEKCTTKEDFVVVCCRLGCFVLAVFIFLLQAEALERISQPACSISP